MTEKLLHKELSYKIIGAAMEVHRVLGPGFLESVYETALAHEFDLREIPYQRQVRLIVNYKDITLMALADIRFGLRLNQAMVYLLEE